MVTRRNFDKIAWIVTAVMAAVTLLFMNGKSLGVESMEISLGYESRLFDHSKVHTIDIVMDDWDSFIESARSEVYSPAAVIIDGEAFRNVGIRGKGNTSLSSVASMDSQRYSFKIEFDQYDPGKTYYGLDKLALNNLIQDSTMMKDYLAYTMMNEFGVNAPLCSFVYITVNGEDWGLYLAVEGVEDSFLERNYGANAGKLYKPDSIGFGGGRGNGQDFKMSEFWKENFEDSDEEGSEDGTVQTADTDVKSSENGSMPSMPGMPGQGGGFPGGMPDMGSFTPPDMGDGGFTPPEMGQGGFTPPDMENGSFTPPDMGNGSFAPPEMGDGSFTPPEMGTGSGDQSGMPGGGRSGHGRGGFGGFGGFGGGMGSSDVKLQYIDDDPDSYSNIWENAKTDYSAMDQERLIESLKKLSENEDIESVVDIDQVLRYFVVHNYVCNGDSYTGAMVHNYYLYEKDGQMAMIPWDYNLAYGTFQGSDAEGTINTPIDSPASGGSSDRPMLNWIFENEEYTEMYHQYFAEFLESVDITGIIDAAYELIAPYVEKDPTKFYTYDDFVKGVETLRDYCSLRTESIQLQLENGETTEQMDYVDASGLNLSAMGSMGGGGGGKPGGGGGMPGSGMPGGRPEGRSRPGWSGGQSESDGTAQPPADLPEGFSGPENAPENAPETGTETESSVCASPDCSAAETPGAEQSGFPGGGPSSGGRPQPPDMGGGMMPPDGMDFGQASMPVKEIAVWSGVSLLVLCAGLISVKKYRL